MRTLSLRDRIKLNALVMQFSEVSDPSFTLALFERVLQSSGSAEKAFDAVRESGHVLWNQRMAAVSGNLPV